MFDISWIDDMLGIGNPLFISFAKAMRILLLCQVHRSVLFDDVLTSWSPLIFNMPLHFSFNGHIMPLGPDTHIL